MQSHIDFAPVPPWRVASCQPVLGSLHVRATPRRWMPAELPFLRLSLSSNVALLGCNILRVMDPSGQIEGTLTSRCLHENTHVGVRTCSQTRAIAHVSYLGASGA